MLQGRLQEAVPVYERAIALFEKGFGAENPELAASLHSFSLVLWKMGRITEAIPHLAHAMRIRQVRGESNKAAEYVLQLLWLKAGRAYPYPL